MIQVLIADDHPLVRDGLRTLLEPEPDIEISAEAADYDELLLSVSSTIDVVVTDLSMPGVGIRAALRELSARFPGLPVLLMSMCAESELRAATEGLGAAGVLDKFKAGSELATAIRTVVAGRSYPPDLEPAGS